MRIDFGSWLQRQQSMRSCDSVGLGPLHSEARYHGGLSGSPHIEDRAVVEEGPKEDPSKSPSVSNWATLPSKPLIRS